MLNIPYFYRKLFCRKGYGVHSPFVFDLITNVIEDKSVYYSYNDISLIRKQLTQNNKFIHYREKRITVKKALQRYGISKKEGEFLFRLSNHYKPRTILAIGSSFGLSSLYLSRYDSTVHCITLECEPGFAKIATHYLKKEANPSHHIRTGPYREIESETLLLLSRIDCIFIDKNVGPDDLGIIFNQFLPVIHEDTFWVLAGIRSSSEKYHFWEKICQHPQVTVAVDMFQMGLLFFQSKLHKRIYKTIIP